LDANPDSDDVKFDLADAYFRKGLYSQALEAAAGVSTAGRQDDAYLALLATFRHIWVIPYTRPQIFRRRHSPQP